MNQAVAARQDVDEGTELGDVHHPAGVGGPDLSRGRLQDETHLALGLAHDGNVHRRDGHRALETVVVDGEAGPGLGLDGVDDLALGPDHLADLVHGDGEADDLGGGGAYLVAGSGDGVVHDLKDLQASVAGLGQGGGQHIGGDTVDLGVELQSGHELRGAGHLEVHVTKGIFGAQDVGQGGVLAIGKHQPHGDTGHRRLDGHPGVHQRQAGTTHRGHGGGAVGGQHLRHQAQGVGELVGLGNHRQQRPLGQQTVADLTPLGTAHEAGFPRGEGRHVVVVHVALALDDVDAVDHLVHAGHAQGGHVDHVGFAPLEEARAVHAGQHAHFRGQRTQVLGTTTVDAETLVHDAATHQALGQAASGRLDLLVGVTQLGEAGQQLRQHSGAHLAFSLVALGLARDGDDRRHPLGGGSFHRRVDLGRVVDLLVEAHDRLGPTGLLDQLFLQLDQVLDVHLGHVETLGEGFLGDLGRARLGIAPGGGGAARLDHHDGHIAVVELATGHHHLEGRLLALLVGGMGNPLTGGSESQTHRPDGRKERDAGHHQRGRGAVDDEHVVGVDLVRPHDRGHDVDLVAEALREVGPQRPIGEAAGQDGAVGGSALTTKEAAGDLAGGVHALFHVHGQREEVHPLAYRLGRGGGHQHVGAADAADHGGVGLAGELAGLQGEQLVGGAGDRRAHADGFCHLFGPFRARCRARARSTGTHQFPDRTRRSRRPPGSCFGTWELAAGSSRPDTARTDPRCCGCCSELVVQARCSELLCKTANERPAGRSRIQVSDATRVWR